MSRQANGGNGFGLPLLQTHGPAGARVPERELLAAEQGFPDDDEPEDVPMAPEQGALGAFYDGPDDDAPPDAVGNLLCMSSASSGPNFCLPPCPWTGPRPMVDAELTEGDLLRVPGTLEATEAATRAAQEGGEAGGAAFMETMEAAEEAYERDHGGGGGSNAFGADPTAGGASPRRAHNHAPGSPRSPRSPRVISDAARDRVRAQLAAALSANVRMPGCLGDPAAAASAAARAEARLFEVSHGAKTVYQSVAANAVRLAGGTESVEELARVSAGEPRALAKGGGAPDGVMFVEGMQGVGLKAEY